MSRLRKRALVVLILAAAVSWVLYFTYRMDDLQLKLNALIEMIGPDFDNSLDQPDPQEPHPAKGYPI